MKDEDGASLISLKDIVKKAKEAGKLKLEIGSVSSLDGDVVLYKRDDVSEENKKLYFETLKASTEYRMAILDAVKEAGETLVNIASLS